MNHGKKTSTQKDLQAEEAAHEGPKPSAAGSDKTNASSDGRETRQSGRRRKRKAARAIEDLPKIKDAAFEKILKAQADLRIAAENVII